MLTLLQKTLHYIEKENAWHSFLQATIADKELERKLLAKEILEELKEQNRDSGEVKIAEDDVVIKEEFSDVADDIQPKTKQMQNEVAQASGEVAILEDLNNGHIHNLQVVTIKEELNIKDYNKEIKSDDHAYVTVAHCSPIEKNLENINTEITENRKNYDGLSKAVGDCRFDEKFPHNTLDHDMSLQISTVQSLLHNILLYTESQKNWFTFLQTAIAGQEKDYKSLHAIITKEILRELGTQKEDVHSHHHDVKMKEDEIVIKEECPDPNSDIINFNELQPSNEMQSEYEEDVKSNRLLLDCNNHSEISCVNEDYQRRNNEEMKIVEMNSDVATIKEDPGDMKEETVNEIEIDDDRLCYYISTSCDDGSSLVEIQNEGLDKQITCGEQLIVSNIRSVKHGNFRQLQVEGIGNISDGAIINEETDANEATDGEIELNYDSSNDYRYVPKEEDDENDKLNVLDVKLNNQTFNTLRQENNEQMELASNNASSEQLKVFAVESTDENTLSLVPFKAQKPKFECPQCKKILTSRLGFSRHMITHTGEKPFKCTYCGKTFNRRGNCNTHMRIHTGKKPYNCTYCRKSFNQSGQVKQHILNKHTNKDEKIFEDNIAKMRMIEGDLSLSSNEEMTLECKYCSRKFPYLCRLKEHVRKLNISGVDVAHYSTEETLKCEYCKEIFPDICGLAHHLREMSQSEDEKSNRSLECSFCQKTFPYICHLKQHLRTHNRMGGTDEKRYQCSYCGKLFRNSGTLVIHIRSHTGEKPYDCPYCDSTFSNSANRARHVRTHTGEKPFKCQFCDKTFNHSGNRKQHMLKHTGEKPYECSYCGKSFRDRTNLSRHIRTHTEPIMLTNV